MDKRGFIRILEAVIAILIVFGAILMVLPSSGDVEDNKIPPDLEKSANAILKEIENDPEFRYCLLQKGATAKCVSKFVSQSLPYGSTLDFSFAIEPKNGDTKYYTSEGSVAVTADEFTITPGVPSNVNVYSKSVYISVEDVSAVEDPQNLETDKTIRIFFWFRLEE